MHGFTNTVADEFADDSVVVAFNKAFDSVRNVANSVTGSGKTNCIIERFAGGIDQSCVFVSNWLDEHSMCIIADKTSVTHDNINRNNISS